MEYILRTNTVSKKYTNYYAVDKVSISIKKGEIYGLIGENGAGKSTLMKMIAGLVEPSEGSVELFGTRDQKLPAPACILYMNRFHLPIDLHMCNKPIRTIYETALCDMFVLHFFCSSLRIVYIP